MTIEIKRWTDGKVLFIAENAADVKQALEEAVLRGAVLRGAVLRGADLRDADLSGAVLSGAVLRDADLRGAVLRGAVLRGADLSDADLSGADLSDADLRDWRIDMWDVLDHAPAEAAGLREALLAGRVNGMVYEGECACLVGTIANVKGCAVSELASVGIPTDAGRPAEGWFMAIREGDKALEARPDEWVSESVFRATLAVEWIDEWRASREAIAEALNR